jgi:hypothetical protein
MTLVPTLSLALVKGGRLHQSDIVRQHKWQGIHRCPANCVILLKHLQVFQVYGVSRPELACVTRAHDVSCFANARKGSTKYRFFAPCDTQIAVRIDAPAKDRQIAPVAHTIVPVNGIDGRIPKHRS